ncbi:AraC family transcriptional regulator [Piscinibacter sp.]|uniref:AraC family transcriptional regulator n=1 Tax=Piscinibacter sp. TaxID=1903157 RepID=UPI002B808386|nr:AraC family transcriptional regulator [Albitalea sp.]HUG20929.1 AraC family transcriptional regulator [Albitalea sp.]
MNKVHDRSSELPAPSSVGDVLSDVLSSVRLTGSMLFLVDAHPPWMSWAPEAEAFRRVVLPQAQHMVSYHIVTRGRCWAGLRGAAPERFEAGDVLVIPHGAAYFLADSPEATPAYGAEEAVTFFRQMAAGELPSVVAEGGRGGEQTQFICGFLGCDTRPFNPVLAALAPLIHLRAASSAADRMRPLIEFALCELRGPSSGGRSVLLRLAELMFIEVVRRHLETVSTGQAGWLAGLHDPLVARTLSLLHGAPARRWTLDTLAAQTGTSRSVLAERFTQFVGQPPMHYLTQWRMQLAARMLGDPGVKVATVAAALGYESEAAFSRAFKRSAGMAPAGWRRRGEMEVGGVTIPTAEPRHPPVARTSSD